MPKLKTRKSAARRVKRTASGKYRHFRAGKRHILTKKNAKRKRRLGKDAAVKKADMRRVRAALPYG